MFLDRAQISQISNKTKKPWNKKPHVIRNCYFLSPFQVRSIPLVVAPVTGSTKLLKTKETDNEIYINSIKFIYLLFMTNNQMSITIPL